MWALYFQWQEAESSSEAAWRSWETSLRFSACLLCPTYRHQFTDALFLARLFLHAAFPSHPLPPPQLLSYSLCCPHSWILFITSCTSSLRLSYSLSLFSLRLYPPWQCRCFPHHCVSYCRSSSCVRNHSLLFSLTCFRVATKQMYPKSFDKESPKSAFSGGFKTNDEMIFKPNL